MEEKIRCSVCGANLNEETAMEFEGNVYCDNCLSENTVVCADCNERIWREDAEGEEDLVLCRRCYDYNYTSCEDCGRLLHNDDAYYDDDESDYPYCHACYQRRMHYAIKNYNYKPETIFYGDGNLFYGVELEIDKGGEYNENAQKILEVGISGGEKIYCKHDGSINNGFEIVSHAATIEYHLSRFPWKDIMEKAIELGYCSHNTSTCGLHIHASRAAFGDTYEKQEEVIGRIVHFVELHWNEILKFTRRTEDNINRWAARYGISTKAKDTYKNAKDKHMGRYVAVNLENCNTIEFRLFRGTLLYSTFAATLQLVDEICQMAISLSDKEVESMSWSDFVLRIPEEKAELIAYLKIKRLYVNEVNTEMEEI